MAENDVVLTIIDKQVPAFDNSVDYQPFGVKILKLRVQRNQMMKPDLGPIWVHPEGYTRPDVNDPDKQRVYGTAVNDPDLWVAWGAGDERGFCIKTKDRFKINKVPLPLDDDGEYFVYLHLIHRPTDPFNHIPVEQELVIQTTGENGTIHGQINVKLTVPEGAVDSLRAHWQWHEQTATSSINLQGPAGRSAQLPRYVSRWWPSSQMKYETVDQAAVEFLSDLRVSYQRQDNGQENGRIDIHHGDTHLAHFSGDIALPLHDYRLINVELFRFLDERHLVLRLWFYWVHLGFSETDLLTFVSDQDAAMQAEAKRVHDGLRRGLLPWHKREEVPDLERFDLLLDPQNLAIKYVGTDTHWQEFWARVKTGQPLEARIATLLDTFRVITQGDNVPSLESPPVFDPLANGLCDIVNQMTPGFRCPHRPSGELLTAIDLFGEAGDFPACQQCGSHFVGDEDVRALGVAKHAPLLGNVDILKNLVSTNVLEG